MWNATRISIEPLFEIFLLREESKIHKRDHNRDFNQRTDYGGKCLIGTDAENSNGYSDSKLKIVTCGCKRKSSGLFIIDFHLSRNMMAKYRRSGTAI